MNNEKVNFFFHLKLSFICICITVNKRTLQQLMAGVRNFVLIENL